MKRLMFFGALCGAVALLSSCGNTATTTNSTEADSTAMAAQVMPAEAVLPIDLPAPVSYEDTIPAADCPGIVMRVTFNNPDGTYTLSRQYLDRDAQPELVTGTVELLDSAAKTLVLRPQDTAQQVYRFKVEQDAIRLLNTDGTEVTGELADHYLLKKLAL